DPAFQAIGVRESNLARYRGLTMDCEVAKDRRVGLQAAQRKPGASGARVVVFIEEVAIDQVANTARLDADGQPVELVLGDEAAVAAQDVMPAERPDRAGRHH